MEEVVVSVPEGSLAGNVWFLADVQPNLAPKPFWLVLQCRLHQKSPGRPLLRPFRGTKIYRPDCLQVPRLDDRITVARLSDEAAPLGLKLAKMPNWP